MGITNSINKAIILITLFVPIHAHASGGLPAVVILIPVLPVLSLIIGLMIVGKGNRIIFSSVWAFIFFTIMLWNWATHSVHLYGYMFLPYISLIPAVYLKAKKEQELLSDLHAANSDLLRRAKKAYMKRDYELSYKLFSEAELSVDLDEASQRFKDNSHHRIITTKGM